MSNKTNIVFTTTLKYLNFCFLISFKLIYISYNIAYNIDFGFVYIMIIVDFDIKY